MTLAPLNRLTLSTSEDTRLRRTLSQWTIVSKGLCVFAVASLNCLGPTGQDPLEDSDESAPEIAIDTSDQEPASEPESIPAEIEAPHVQDIVPSDGSFPDDQLVVPVLVPAIDPAVDPAVTTGETLVEGTPLAPGECEQNWDCPAVDSESQYCHIPEGLCSDRGECSPSPEESCYEQPKERQCGCDGDTYYNACLANNHGDGVAYEGWCTEDVEYLCTLPVTDWTSTTQPNTSSNLTNAASLSPRTCAPGNGWRYRDGVCYYNETDCGVIEGFYDESDCLEQCGMFFADE